MCLPEPVDEDDHADGRAVRLGECWSVVNWLDSGIGIAHTFHVLVYSSGPSGSLNDPSAVVGMLNGVLYLGRVLLLP